MSNLMLYSIIGLDVVIILILVIVSLKREDTNAFSETQAPNALTVENLKTAISEIETRILQVAHTVKDYEDSIVEYSLKLERDKKNIQNAISEALASMKSSGSSSLAIPPQRSSGPESRRAGPNGIDISADEPISLPLEEKPELKKDTTYIQKNRNFEVINLFRQGKDINEIARTLGIAKGEIELILSLNRDKTI